MNIYFLSSDDTLKYVVSIIADSPEEALQSYYSGKVDGFDHKSLFTWYIYDMDKSLLGIYTVSREDTPQLKIDKNMSTVDQRQLDIKRWNQLSRDNEELKSLVMDLGSRILKCW